MKIKVAILVFPGTNCNRDTVEAFTMFHRAEVKEIYWYEKESLASFDLICLPGGFSYGDYLRSGAIAAALNFKDQILEASEKGKIILGICNGFQILTELNLLPGALLINEGLNFISDNARLNIINKNSVFTSDLPADKPLEIPIANYDGLYHCDEETASALEKENRIIFRYAEQNRKEIKGKIAGIINQKGNILGMMPHPERAIRYRHNSTDGFLFFHCLIRSFL